MKAMYELLNEARQQGIELSTIATPIENNHGFDIYESEDFYLIDRRYGEGFDEYPKDYYTLDEAIDEGFTYDVQFDDDCNSNNKGWSKSIDYCKDYIDSNNRTNECYFEDYKGGVVSVICNETDEVVYKEIVR